MGEGNLFITKGHSSVSIKAIALVLALLSPVAARAQASACVMMPELPLLAEAPQAAAAPASATEASAAMVELRSTDPVGPFPLSALVPFSWASIDGIWSMKLPDGTALYLSLQVQADCDGRRFLRVVNFDQKSYRVQSEGMGLALANDTTVRAVMTSPASQHMLFIRQYKVPVGKAGSKISTVVTIRPFNGSNNDDVHMIARKASSLTLDQYIQRQRDIEAERSARAVVR